MNNETLRELQTLKTVAIAGVLLLLGCFLCLSIITGLQLQAHRRSMEAERQVQEAVERIERLAPQP